jgi:hypothetical protein
MIVVDGPLLMSQNQAIRESRYVGSALIVSRDKTIASLTISALSKYAISADVCLKEELPRRISRSRYELLVIDWESDVAAMEVLDTVRSAPSMRTAVVLAIVPNSGKASEASAIGAHFVLQPPISRVALDNVIRAAFGLIVRERRRYFRCPIDISVIAHRRTEGAWQGRLANISEGGMCILPPVSLRPGEHLTVEFVLPSSSAEISAECDVQWADAEGRVGLQFERISPQAKSDLQHWLTQQLDAVLRPTLSRLGYRNS